MVVPVSSFLLYSMIREKSVLGGRCFKRPKRLLGELNQSYRHSIVLFLTLLEITYGIRHRNLRRVKYNTDNRYYR
ncbi:MAG: hypothetical protein WAM14_07900, partial [Candidatus Nitrosopolaris sp.]